MTTARKRPSQERPGTSLLNDPDAEVCTQFPVFRHPFYRSLKHICYLGMPAFFVAALLLAQGVGAMVALGCSFVFMLLVFASLVAAEQHARAAAAFRAADRLRRGWQFVCPGCLHTGPVRHACGACKEELEPFVMLTRGWYLNDCAHCHAHVFGSLWGRGTRPNALCPDCGHVTDTRQHRRRVQMTAVLQARDLETLCGAVEGSLEEGPDGRYCFRDTGDVMHYAVDLGTEEGGALPARHAARQVSAVWMDAVLDDPLRLGEALDRLIRKSELGEASRREMRLCTPRTELPAAVRNVIEGRFGRIECGVSAEAFLFGAARGESQARLPVRIGRLPEVEEPEAAQLTMRVG